MYVLLTIGGKKILFHYLDHFIFYVITFFLTSSLNSTFFDGIKKSQSQSIPIIVSVVL